MNKIAELISRLCPDGVEFKTLDSLVSYVQPGPYIVSSTEYDAHYSTPVLTAGQSFILGYTNEEEGIYNASPQKPVIIFDDFTTSFHWVDFDFKVKSSALKILKMKDKQEADFRYIYMAMKTIHFIPTNHIRHWISLYSKFEIPLPPLNIQKEIVSILDSFTSLIGKMKQEVEMRKKQMEYYREKLMAPQTNWKIKTLGEIGTFTRGNGLQKSDFRVKGFPCVHYGQIHTYYNTCIYKTKSFCEEDLAKKLQKASYGDLLIATTSEDVKACCKAAVWFGAGDVAYSGDSFCYSHDQDPKYMAYLFQTEMFAKQKQKAATGAKVIRVSGESMASFSFAFPPLVQQRQIVSILDTFETYISKLEKMIELRQKQYEYYREKLLTFE
jgi:type I restriction enzyme S subunit